MLSSTLLLAGVASLASHALATPAPAPHTASKVGALSKRQQTSNQPQLVGDISRFQDPARCVLVARLL